MENILENRFEKYHLPQLTRGVRLPDYKVSFVHKKKYGLKPNQDNFDFLCLLVNEGIERCLKTKMVGDNIKLYQNRIDQELNTFKELGFTDYVLLIWDIVNYCRENDIATGYGRGSAGGSLILYLIDVTKIDSIEYGCYFERFLSKTRAKFVEVDGVRYYDGKLLMDVDLDISFSDRHLVSKYLEQKYAGKIAKLPNVSTLTTKILIKEVLKTMYEWSESEVNAVTELIPVEFGKPFSIQKSIEASPDFKAFADKYPEVIEHAQKLYLLARHKSVHASAWLITHDPLNDFLPLELDKHKELVTSFTMDDALKIAVKVDLLGLRAVTLIHNVCKMVGIKMEDINFHDPLIYESIQNLQTPHGCFQIEADCNFNVLKKVKPKNLNHLAAVLSLGRPGAIEFVDSFAEFVESGEFQVIHNDFANVLKDTAGVPIFQEDLMRIAHEVFGFTLEQAELLRRAVGKKSHEEMAKFQSVLEQKGAELNRQESANKFWEILNASADYSFNKSHAICYACTCAATVYLKFKYPLEFFCSLLQLVKHETDPIEEFRTIYSELKYFGIKLLPPSLVSSGIDFTIENGSIRCGLGSIKGISDKGIEKLLKFRNSYSNKFEVFKAASESGIPINILSSLILCGALDDPQKPESYLDRNKLLYEAQVFNKLSDREKVLVLNLGDKFNFQLFDVIKHLTTALGPNNKPYISQSRVATIRKHIQPYKNIYLANNINDEYRLFSVWKLEKMLLGHPYSITLQDVFAKKDTLYSIQTVSGELDNTIVVTVGEISEFTDCISRNGNRQWKFYLSDQSGKIKIYFTNNKKIDRINEYHESGINKPENGNIAIITGKKVDQAIFAETIVVQPLKIISKISDMEEEEAQPNLINIPKKT